MKIRQHIPGFCEGFEKEEVEYSTLEELFNIAFVKRWSNTTGFDKFSMSRHGDQVVLMAEFEMGWQVAGYLTDGLPDLPKWEAP